MPSAWITRNSLLLEEIHELVNRMSHHTEKVIPTPHFLSRYVTSVGKDNIWSRCKDRAMLLDRLL